MKKLFLTLVTFSILFVIGCQENSITDPITVEPTNKVQPDPSHQGTITLERMLRDPYPVMNSYFIINGEVEYDLSLELINSGSVGQQYSVSLNLTTTAEFTYLCTVCGENNDETTAGNIGKNVNRQNRFGNWHSPATFARCYISRFRFTNNRRRTSFWSKT